MLLSFKFFFSFSLKEKRKKREKRCLHAASVFRDPTGDCVPVTRAPFAYEMFFFSRWKEKQVSFWRFGMAFSTPRNGSDGRRIWNALKVLFLLHRREGETDAAVTKSVSPVLSLSFQQAEREAFHRFSNKINDGEKKKQKRKDKIQRLVRTVEIVNADSEFVFAAVDGLGDSFVVLAV